MPSLVQVHKSFAVNIDHVTAMKYDEIWIGDVIIPVGRTYRENIPKPE